VTSTNLAHTAPYCLHTSPGTMAERYHKSLFQNSTLVLPSPPSRPPNLNIRRNSAIFHSCKDIALLAATPFRPQPTCSFLAKDPRCTGQSGEELSLGLRCDKMSRPMRAGK